MNKTRLLNLLFIALAIFICLYGIVWMADQDADADASFIRYRATMAACGKPCQ